MNGWNMMIESPALLTLITVYTGLVVWLLTTVMVESELCRPVRQWFKIRETMYQDHEFVPASWDANDEVLTYALERWPTRKSRTWNKLAYLVSCHLCTGTWVGLGMALVVPGPFMGVVTPVWLAVILNGFTFKAIGHLVLVVVNWFRGDSGTSTESEGTGIYERIEHTTA